MVVASVNFRSTVRNVTGVTIGGVAATQIVGGDTQFAQYSAMWAANVPSGATADVVVTCAASDGKDVIVTTTAFTGFATSPSDTGIHSVNAATSVTINAPNNSIVVAAAYVRGDSGNNPFVWTGVTSGPRAHEPTRNQTVEPAYNEVGGAGSGVFTVTADHPVHINNELMVAVFDAL